MTPREFSHIKYNGKLYRPCEVGSHSVNGVLDLTQALKKARKQGREEGYRIGLIEGNIDGKESEK